MYKAYKYRIYPTQEQAVFINKTIGCARFVYNALLADAKKLYEETGKSKVKSYGYLTKEFEWLKEVDSQALCYAQLNLRTAYAMFFSKKSRFPKFHSKHNEKQSYKTQNIKSSIRIDNGKLRLPKLGFINIVLHRFCYGKIKSVTVTRTPTNKYFVSILTEQDDKTVINQNKDKVLGLDMSLKELAVYSDGTRAKYPMFMRKSLKRLAHAQRNLSRTKAGSKNHEKMRLRVAKVYEKVSNQRKDFLDKESTRIARSYGTVVVEDVNMMEMAKKGGYMGDKAYDVGFGMFRDMLSYKLAIRGGRLVKADKDYPSSQLCSNCGFKNIAVKNLNVREWDCPNCGVHHDRDVNAAINLMKLCTAASAGTEACGESVSPMDAERRSVEIGGFVEAGKTAELRKLQAV